jgi:type II secretory pathway predicted ATPase ExeA
VFSLRPHGGQLEVTSSFRGGEVMDFFGLEKELDHLGFFATEAQTHLEQEITKIISQGRLIALSGIVGSGKTTFFQRLIADLGKAKEIIVSRSLAVESDRVSLSTLITALFYDLSTEKDFKVPTQPEKRERRLLELIKKCQRTVVLFVDDAHGLHHRTLVGLKRLIELVRHNGGKLSVVLAGHPKLKNALRRPTLEEIGGRANVFALEGIGLDDLEPSLIRHGYNAKSLAELLNVRTTEVRSFLHGQLPQERLRI